MKKKVLIIVVVFSIITLIGFISFICKTRGVNAGAFILPGIMTILLYYIYNKSSKS